jgi:hypothetical protein
MRPLWRRGKGLSQLQIRPTVCPYKTDTLFFTIRATSETRLGAMRFLNELAVSRVEHAKATLLGICPSNYSPEKSQKTRSAPLDDVVFGKRVLYHETAVPKG